MPSMSAEGTEEDMIESEERRVEVALFVDCEGIKPELERRSSPVWVIPILLHLANLTTTY